MIVSMIISALLIWKWKKGSKIRFLCNKRLYVSFSFRVKNKKRFNDEITLNVEFDDNFDDSALLRFLKRKNVEFDDFDYMSLFSSVNKKRFERPSWNVKSKWMLNLMIISMMIPLSYYFGNERTLNSIISITYLSFLP